MIFLDLKDHVLWLQIRAKMRERGIKQVWLAERLGIDTFRLSRLLNGKAVFREIEEELLCDFFGIELREAAS